MTPEVRWPSDLSGAAEDLVFGGSVRQASGLMTCLSKMIEQALGTVRSCPAERPKLLGMSGERIQDQQQLRTRRGTCDPAWLLAWECQAREEGGMNISPQYMDNLDDLDITVIDDAILTV